MIEEDIRSLERRTTDLEEIIDFVIKSTPQLLVDLSNQGGLDVTDRLCLFIAQDIEHTVCIEWDDSVRFRAYNRRDDPLPEAVKIRIAQLKALGLKRRLVVK